MSNRKSCFSNKQNSINNHQMQNQSIQDVIFNDVHSGGRFFSQGHCKNG